MELTAGSGAGALREATGGGPSVRETYWGYVLREDGPADGGESLREAGLRFAGLVLLLAGYGQWLLPAALFAGEPMVAKAGLSFLLGAVGVALYWHASRGTCRDLHVDLSRRELRVVTRNARGQERLRSVLPMAGISGVYVARPRNGAGPARLCLRLRDRDDAIPVAEGEEAAMRAVHARLARDLRPLGERVDERLAQTVPFRSCRTG